MEKIDRMKNLYVELPIKNVFPNPNQPRKKFDRSKIAELARSIKNHGLIQPITVRVAPVGYELISGERRLIACRMAGMTRISAIITDVDDCESAELALIENIQREDLDYFEEAECLGRLIQEYGFKQDELAERLGKSQPSIANKLRLLKLDRTIKERLQAAGLSERHARALLRLPTIAEQTRVLDVILKDKLNVDQTDNLINREKKGRIHSADTLLRSIFRAVDALRLSGVDAQSHREEDENFIQYTIKVAKEQ